jgi:hypothetical protein
MREGKRFLDEASTGNQMPPRVSIDHNQFALIDPSGASTRVPSLPDGPALDMVVVDLNQVTSKLYWGKAFTRDQVAPPICWSDNGNAPSSLAQNPQSTTCATCPHNVIGSAIGFSGARIKACGDLKKFAVIVKGFQGVYQFTVKPGSFKSWNNYTRMLQLQKLPQGGKPDLCDIVTRVRFSGQGVHSFEPLELVDGELADRVMEIWEKNKEQDVTGMIVGRYDQPHTGALPEPHHTVLGTRMQSAPSWTQPQPVGITAPIAQPQVPPPPPKPALFAQPQQPAAPPAPEPKKPRAAPKPVETDLAPPVPPHGLQEPQQGLSAEVQDRLFGAFNLPTVK